jgi:glutathione S-transferase
LWENLAVFPHAAGVKMSLPEPLKLKGVPGSPYTRKMLAYLRFRRIRYELLVGDQATAAGMPAPKVNLLPTFYLPNEQGEIEAVVDSTPLIRRFEREFAERATIPSSPVLSFVNYLVEDYADEWLTKAMFHYRWYYDADIAMAAKILPRWSGLQATEEMLDKQAEFIADRQISRLYVVGSNDVTAPVIEDSFKRFLPIMDGLIEQQKFVLGTRPASADFAIYAQLTQLAKFDPTPSAICLDLAPRVYAWTDVMDDLSGQPADDDAWIDPDEVGERLGPLLAEIGRVYAPALLANAEALQAGSEQMETTIDGRRWVQPAFAYQGKCLQWINQEYAALAERDREAVDRILAGTGCEAMIRGRAS